MFSAEQYYSIVLLYVQFGDISIITWVPGFCSSYESIINSLVFIQYLHTRSLTAVYLNFLERIHTQEILQKCRLSLNSAATQTYKRSKLHVCKLSPICISDVLMCVSGSCKVGSNCSVTTDFVSQLQKLIFIERTDRFN